MMSEEMFCRKRRLSSFQIIILGFAGVILLGALLLMLPISATARCVTPFHEALFTATSAVCVTGLVVHPENCAGFVPADIDELRELARQPKVAAIGEIGLDYYWAENPPRELQQQVLRAQLALARALRLPVIFHDREAHGDSLTIVREFPDVTGVFHCFSGSPEMARELLDLGWYLGFDGPVTYKNARRAPEVAAVTPLDRMLIETDSPYMTPVPHRGERNDSAYVRLVAEKLAEWKGVPVEQLARATLENGKRLFRISE